MSKKTSKENTSTQLEDQIKQLEELLENEKNGKLQAMADFQNFRRYVEQERATFGALANAGLIQELLEVYDDIQLALNDADLELESAKKALTNAQEKLIAAAKAAGVEPLEVNPGDDFDSSKMEAISTIPDADNSNKVVAVISTGFKYRAKDGVIKSTKVVVGK